MSLVNLPEPEPALSFAGQPPENDGRIPTTRRSRRHEASHRPQGRIGPLARLMRVAIPIWFEVESLEEETPTEDLSEGQVEAVAARAADLLAWIHRDGMEDDIDVILVGIGRVRVKLLGTDPD